MDKKLDYSNLDKHHLQTLIDFSQTINSFNSKSELVNHLLLVLMGKFLLKRSAFYIFENNSLKLVSSKGIDLSNNYRNFIIENEKNFEHEIEKIFLNERLFSNYKLLIQKDKKIGIILYSFHLNKKSFQQEEQNLFESILNLSIPAIDNLLIIENLNELNKRLQSKISQTRSLFELSKELSLILDENDIYKFLSYTIMGNFLINKFALVSITNNQKEIIGSNFESSFSSFLDNIDVNNLRSPLKFEDLLKINPEFSEFSNLNIGLIIPIEIKNSISSIIICGKKLTKTDFISDEIEFIESLGSVAAISLENIHLFRETIEKQKIEEDIRIAKEIQKKLLPASFPVSNFFEFYGFNQSSRQVGGDYFDVFRITNEQILILIADVVGKGIGASLIMSNFQATVKAITRKSSNLGELTKELNNLMFKNLQVGNFITLFWGILDEKTKSLQYVNAGHNPPFLIRNHEIIKLEKGGMIIGIIEQNLEYEIGNIDLQSGDLLCLYTDGCIEARNQNDEELSEERFIEKILEYKNLTLEIITNKLIDDVLTFTADLNSLDDLTLLLCKVK